MKAFAWLRWAALVTLLTGLASCGSEPDFLYQFIPPNYAKYDEIHRIKDAKGFEKADILWVIDNSGSMGTHHQKLIQNMHLFIGQFLILANNLDWKMGLISTSIGELPYLGFTPETLLDYRTPDPGNIFNQAVARLGTAGDMVEQSFGSTLRALNSYGDFLRERAGLFLIFISDESEGSSQTSVDSFIQSLIQHKAGDPKSLVTYAVTSMAEQGCPQDRYSGGKFEDFLKKTTGKHYTLCSPDFGLNLADIAKDIGYRLQKPRIDLNTIPLPQSIRVFYKSQELPGGDPQNGGLWIYHSGLNAVIFHDLEFAGGSTEDVRITFKRYY